MGEIRDRRDALTVRVESPDGGIRAILKGGSFQSLGFRPGRYRDYREPRLEHQLSRLATLLFTGHSRGMRLIKEQAGVRSYSDPAMAIDETERRYLEGIRSFTAIGAGSLDVVRVRTVGMLDWRCKVRPGSVARLSEDEFAAEATAAAHAVRLEISRQITRIKDDCYGLRRPGSGVPRRLAAVA